MTDYDKLVAALRETDFGDTCVYCEHSDMCKAKDCIIFQAADAIEALQAEHKKTVTQIFCEEQMAWEGRCKDLMYQIADLQAQLPKRGEWVELGYQPNVHETRYRCSLCGRQVLILSGSGELLKTYPYCHCGAKMDVQDG